MYRSAMGDDQQHQDANLSANFVFVLMSYQHAKFVSGSYWYFFFLLVGCCLFFFNWHIALTVLTISDCFWVSSDFRFFWFRNAPAAIVALDGHPESQLAKDLYFFLQVCIPDIFRCLHINCTMQVLLFLFYNFCNLSHHFTSKIEY